MKSLQNYLGKIHNRGELTKDEFNLSRCEQSIVIINCKFLKIIRTHLLHIPIFTH